MKLLVLLVTLCFSVGAQADSFLSKALGNVSTGFYLAPYGAYIANGSMKNKISNQPVAADNGDYSYDYFGSRYGVQLGPMIGKVTLGLDISFGTVDFKFKHPSGTQLGESDFNGSLISAFLMYRGNRFAPWIGFIFTGGGKFGGDDNSGLGDAAGISLGLGFKLLQWLQLNVDIRSYAYHSMKDNGTDIKLPITDQDLYNVTETLLGLSIPFEFGGQK